MGLKQSRAHHNHGGRRPRKERFRKESIDEDQQDHNAELRTKRLEERRPEDTKNETCGPEPPPWRNARRRGKPLQAASNPEMQHDMGKSLEKESASKGETIRTVTGC